jgi:hypothetical protein
MTPSLPFQDSGKERKRESTPSSSKEKDSKTVRI